MKPFIPREWIRMRKQPPTGTTVEWVDNIIVGANAPNQSGYAMVRNGVVESEVIKPPYSPGEVCWAREKLYRDMYWAMYEDRTPALNSAGIQVRWEWKKREILPAAFMPKEAARRHVRILSCVPEQRGEWGWKVEWEENNAL